MSGQVKMTRRGLAALALLMLCGLALLLARPAANPPTVVVVTATPTLSGGSAPQAALPANPLPATADVQPLLPATLNPAIAAQLQVATARAAAPPAGDSSWHTVAAGDSLSQIAAHYGFSLAEVLAVNDLADPNLLQINQVINLPQSPILEGAGWRIIADAGLVRSVSADAFSTAAFVRAQPGILHKLNAPLNVRQPDGSSLNYVLPAADVVERVSLEYSVDPRILLAFLEYGAGLLSQAAVEEERQIHPIISPEQSPGIDRAGLYRQLSWLADRLNYGYYDWKYRGRTVLEFADGSRYRYHQDLNAGSAAVQYVFAQLKPLEEWQRAVGEDGFYATYRAYFGAPFDDAAALIPPALSQPPLSLPFRAGEVWRFTGGFHGGWGSGSGWAALDFTPPDVESISTHCPTSSLPAIAVADGTIARASDGVIVLDLDGDGNEGSGWTILYLHLVAAESLRAGQAVQSGEVLGYASCSGGFSLATHLHIARRYQGEWIPADCMGCTADFSVPPFVMGSWQAVGLPNQEYQGYLFNRADSRSAVAEQGLTDINKVAW